jgi:diketogulonate reductase-like aldo/keto reductase
MASAASSGGDAQAPKAVPHVKLANGVLMPQVGFGCAFGNWTDPAGFPGLLPEQAWRAVTLALEAGYRHFDTAVAYSTERHIGSILGAKLASGELQRSDVHITTKVAHPDAPPHVAIARHRTFNARDVPDVGKRVDEQFDRSLDDLGVGYVDLLLMHWPGTFDETDVEFAAQTRLAIWRRLESYLKKGTARAIGCVCVRSAQTCTASRCSRCSRQTPENDFRVVCMLHRIPTCRRPPQVFRCVTAGGAASIRGADFLLRSIGGWVDWLVGFLRDLSVCRC